VTLPRTEVRHLRSTESGVAYKLYVSLPREYEASEQRYPVVYLLDADYSFALARNIVEHLSDRGHLTPAIVVGIAYDGPDRYRLNRTRDYTPTHVPTGGYGPEYQRVSGGGPAFQRFLVDDLVPFVDDTYRAAPERVLVGHSYGGLFATWTALTRPGPFHGFVIVSPSLWYDGGMIFGVKRAWADTHDDLPLRIYMSVGSREVNGQRNMPGDLRRMARALEARSYPGLRLRWDVAADETHNSIFPRALSNGLRFVLEGR
jgi:predicted alpha/beta superfamily hydrolase